MSASQELLLVLEACSRTAPAPLYPAEFALAVGIDRAALDAAMDRLRLAGHLQITDWVKGKGQGYIVTPNGAAALRDPTLLDRPAPAPQAAPRAKSDATPWKRGEIIRAAFLEPGPPIVTMVLIFANVLMFAVGLALALARNIPINEYFAGTPSSTLSEISDSLGALSTQRVILENQWWRLLSYQFLHGHLLHLGMNMLGLYMLGPLLEAVWGSKRYLVLYLTSGFIGGAFVVMMGRNAVGASGSISGMLTSIFVWLWLNRDCLPERIRSNMMSSVGTNLILLVIISFQPNVSWEGHLGGALGGALLSVALHYQRFGRGWQSALGCLACVALPLVAAAGAYLVQTPPGDELARRRLQLRFERPSVLTEQYLLERYNRFLVPLLRNEPANLGLYPEFVPTFRIACDEAVEKVQSLLDQLDGFEPADAVQRQEAQAVRGYFAAWSELFQSLKRHLDEPARWNLARRREVSLRLDTVFELRKPLEANTQMPLFVPLVSKEEPLPAAPPNTG